MPPLTAARGSSYGPTGTRNPCVVHAEFAAAPDTAPGHDPRGPSRPPGPEWLPAPALSGHFSAPPLTRGGASAFPGYRVRRAVLKRRWYAAGLMDNSRTKTRRRLS
ncbi:hypothetical protein GCM10022206_90810 [Streptomyces chiangmaiensis]